MRNRSEPPEAPREAYTRFVMDHQDALRRALIAGFGPEVGREAAAEALVYGWVNWARVRELDNPAGYVYRVGQRIALKMSRTRRPPPFPAAPVTDDPGIEPGLPRAMALLSRRQRAVVVLVHGYGLSQRDAARLLGVSRSSLQRHLERGVRRLRSELGVNQHV